MTELAIHTEGLTRKYGRTLAANHIDMSVPEGAIYALVGPNGAGKTTIIKLLMNIIRPTSGRSEVLGIASYQLAGEAFNRIGCVSENIELPGGMTVEQMLDYFRPFYPTWDRDLERQLVRQFDLPLKRKLKHLSRGMKMKAAFASSLAYHPKLIVLDDPLSGLDPLVRDEVIEGLLERASETTIFLSSHDLAEIENFASHVGFLERGNLLFSEEMSVVTGRFREVTVTLDKPSPLLANLPAAWLHPQTADCVVRFVNSNFAEQSSLGEVSQRFPSARDISFDPMSLRDIFLAIAKAGRGPTSTQPDQPTAKESRA